MRVVLRTKAAPAGVVESARQAIHHVDPGVPLAKVATLATLTGTAMAGERFSMLLVGSFGMFALLLAAVGIYGVISYSVAQRTREIGIRVALGAQRGDVFGMTIRHGLRLSGLGILIGIAAALGMGRFLSSFLYGVTATDPLTFASVSAVLAVIAIGASLVPARRAASVNPVDALRTE